jgi:hypothetical protein
MLRIAKRRGVLRGRTPGQIEPVATNRADNRVERHAARGPGVQRGTVVVLRPGREFERQVRPFRVERKAKHLAVVIRPKKVDLHIDE